jgi:hypothetical protein
MSFQYVQVHLPKAGRGHDRGGWLYAPGTVDHGGGLSACGCAEIIKVGSGGAEGSLRRARP